MPNVEIHTTDRNNFRRCRRKWNWSSSLRNNLVPKFDSREALWIGSGFHFVLEDFHGHKFFRTVEDAWNAYVDAHEKDELPEGYEESSETMIAVLNYYVQEWHFQHFSEYTTLQMPEPSYMTENPDKWPPESVGVFPATEVDFHIRLPVIGEVYYSGTLDRMVKDADGRIWVIDYKTAKRFDTTKLENDPQISAYAWAASLILDRPIEGVIWIQILKEAPKPPKQLVNGTFSKNKQQRTTHNLYRQALLDAYGKIPEEYDEFLNFLAEQEFDQGDKFIRFDRIRRNEHWIFSEQRKILLEVSDMLNPRLSLYPNPTRDCIWDCEFRSACISMDDGSDYRFILDSEFEHRKERDTWRKRINEYYPQKLPAITVDLSAQTTYMAELLGDGVL